MPDESSPEGLTDRPTQDLDFFAVPDSGNVVVARDAFETAAQERGWSVRRVRDGVTFCRLVVSGSDSLVVDIALDTPPSRPPTACFVGPTFDLDELAGRRNVRPVRPCGSSRLHGRLRAGPAEVDMGFDVAVFAQMLGTLSRFDDSEFPIPGDRVSELRSFFASWAVELVDSPAS